MRETTPPDLLAICVFQALKEKSKEDPSWVSEEFEKMKGMDRLEILRSISIYDAEILEAVCAQIGCSVDDMKATLRVLQII